MDILPIEWIRAARYCDVAGDPMDAVYERINNGLWAAGKHYKRTGKRTLWINLPAVTEWINSQPHVEAVAFPRASKSARESAATASA